MISKCVRASEGVMLLAATQVIMVCTMVHYTLGNYVFDVEQKTESIKVGIIEKDNRTNTDPCSKDQSRANFNKYARIAAWACSALGNRRTNAPRIYVECYSSFPKRDLSPL